jgi:hypothetical protein
MLSNLRFILATTLCLGVGAAMAGCGGDDGADGAAGSPPMEAGTDAEPLADASEEDASGSDGGGDVQTDTAEPDAALPPASCPEPDHGPIGSGWPEVFLGVSGCSDTGAGTKDTPFCTFDKAFEVANAVPYVVTLLDGTYRLPEVGPSSNLSRSGTADEYFVIRAAEGAQPVLLGSHALAGAGFEEAGGGLWRVDVSSVPNEPKGMWTAQGERMIHEMVDKDGVRSHADTSALVEEGTWTKADDGGAGCPEENAGCYIYLRPPAGMDVSATNFEVSQRGLFYTQSDYLVVRGLTFKFTQSSAIFSEVADHLLFEDNTFAHNANSNDNSYSLRLWNTNGSIIRNNRVTDSRYWGGAVNSWGITFMLSGETESNWVCGNEIWDIIGMGVGSKGGSSNTMVVGNYIHDVGTGIEIPTSRCHWEGCDKQLWNGGGWTIRENVFVRVGTGIDLRAVWDRPEAIEQSVLHNNLFYDVDRGISVPRNMQMPAPIVRNNLFTGTGAGIFFHAGGETTWPDYWTGLGFDSDYNAFDVENAIYCEANWSGTEKGYGLDAYRAEFEGESHSLELSPGLVGEEPNWTLPAGSPLLGAGDPTVYPDLDSVNIGHLPTP